MQEILMTPDVCMRFLVWSYYYHDVMPVNSFRWQKSERSRVLSPKLS